MMMTLMTHFIVRMVIVKMLCKLSDMFSRFGFIRSTIRSVVVTARLDGSVREAVRVFIGGTDGSAGIVAIILDQCLFTPMHVMWMMRPLSPWTGYQAMMSMHRVCDIALVSLLMRS